MHSVDIRIPSIIRTLGLCAALLGGAGEVSAQNAPKFKVLAFSTTEGDLGHISYEREANKWFPKIAGQYGFQYDSSHNWNDCNAAKLAQYKVVIFLDNRPESASQRDAFKQYMDNGGAWIGCHFAAFALNNSAVPQNWDWYHNTFIGSGEYKSNTWAPTPAYLKVEDTTTPFTAGIPSLFKSSANEWYRWQNDLKTKPDIKILYSIDPSSFPLGTGPKPEEIWHDGYYPVVWTNVKYRMLYLNMGHNDIDYANGNKDKSQTLANDTQNKLIINAILSFAGVTPVALAPVGRVSPDAAASARGFRFNGSVMTVSVPGAAVNGPGSDLLPRFDLHGRELLPAKGESK